MTPPNLLTEWSRLLIGSLARAGVRHAVISPGSRSTPFTWAALNEPLLSTRVVIDERAAAFYAVGHAKITGEPVLLICTSGSAAANYFPAVVEADRSGTPLIVLTADRPFELQAADAPQTIDQVKMYGSAVRQFFELGLPDASGGALRAARRIAAQAVAGARGPVPGPVHVNARARTPLEPVAAADDATRALMAEVDALLAEGPTAAPAARVVASLDGVRDDVMGARRGVIVCGPLAPHQLARRDALVQLARATGFPIFAETTSQLRYGALPDDAVRLSSLDALLRSPAFLERFQPDCVLRIGTAPTSTAYAEFLARAASEREPARRVREHVIAPTGWSDPHGTAATMLVGDVAENVMGLAFELADDEAAQLDRWRERRAWRERLERADAAARAALDGLRPGDEGPVVRALVDALPSGALLALGNSMPVREVDTFAPADARDLGVWSQRGANGIDGLIAGAAGAAAASGRPTALLLGDVSALHDVGGLAVARESDAPLAIVVIDNGGGRIFERLPLAATGVAREDAWQAWLTPPRVDFEALARGFGVGHARATDAAGARTALAGALATRGATVVHVTVDGTRTIAAHHEYWAEVDRRIAALT
ncbi:MAG TPA: 2-succinyl-5-enolpyruvyl-6-hydroxy-3-cyclohexene-1-carboxylic-acid synthase [Longimicrobiales bacterium]